MRRSLALASVLIAATAACSTPSQNFEEETETYINESNAVAQQFGDVDITDAACERPDGTAVGTTYRCTANVPGEGTVSFRIQITAEDEFSIVGFG